MYASVIVDLSAENIDRVFSYEIPAGMSVVPGQIVLVPFGPKRLEGFVVGIEPHCDLPKEKIRAILETVTDDAVVLPEMVEVSKWMQKRYNCNLVDALRLMIPAEMRGGRVHEKQVRVASLAIERADAEKFIAVNRRAVKQAKVVQALMEGDKPVPLLGAMIEGASAAVRALADKGIVKITSDVLRRRPRASMNVKRTQDYPLMRTQQAALDEVTHAVQGNGGRFLLHGVTGSGKTEVYIRIIRNVLAQGKGAIVLVPEIALTPQMVSWFQARFGDDAAVLHSGLSAGERFDEWMRIRKGEAQVVIGARSAVFAPLEKCGIIIVDEEHETSYQSDKRPRYDAREVAWKRMEKAKGVLLLGSATPSISSYMRAMPGVRPENKLTLLEMNERVKGRKLPQVQVVDLRAELQMGNHSIFSAALAAEMKNCLDAGHQAILFINRRGHSTFVSCRACGYVVKCDQCDVSMTYHQAENVLRCHYCGRETEPPKKCPDCGSPYIKFFGVGTEKVEQEVKKLFPGVPVGRMDVDTTRGKDMHQKILDDFRFGRTKILIGTQMIAKGLDFPNVTCVGVVAADMSLNLPDYRSVERTFQLITQVAGRAGRADFPGKVIVQTYDPEHYGIDLAAKQDYRAFYHKEALFRRQGLYPPFTVIARVIFTAREEKKARDASLEMEKQLNAFIDSSGDMRKDIIQMRALEAPIKMLRGEFRQQIFLKMYAKGPVDTVTTKMEDMAQAVADGVKAELEVNPVNMI